MTYTLTAAATRQMRKLPPAVRNQLFAKLDIYAATGAGNVKALQGRKDFRLRAGDYRIIFYIEDGSIIVSGVGHRRDIYD